MLSADKNKIIVLNNVIKNTAFDKCIQIEYNEIEPDYERLINQILKGVKNE